MRRAISITVLSTVAGLAQADNINPFSCSDFLNFNGNQAQTNLLLNASKETLSWNWFRCLNQPAPNGLDRVWETLKPSDQVYLADGAKPTPYGAPVTLPAAVTQAAGKIPGMNLNRVFHNLNATLQVDGLPLEMGGSVPESQRGKPVRFQLLMSESTFDYIVDQGVYNMNGQQALTGDLNFPATSWEAKAGWLWIGSDTTYQAQLANDGYYIAQAYYQNQDGTYEVGYAALSALHVINKLVPGWVWTTFENVNNHSYTVTNDIPPKPMTNSTGPTPAAALVNTAFQAAYKDLSRYELIGTQLQTSPKLLANSQLESAFQSQSSCFACHGTAAYSKDDGYFNFALGGDAGQGGIVYPTDPVPASDFKGYHKLDFVWSLKRAQWQRP
ncbi:hypothetical protein DZC75_11200 [Pseudomonas parafulva]|uniref:Cytochrome C n=1 Tax=Pseudomonas parafulva TaxID=157782 RepID=A0AAI8KBM8_9PSED|nr:hypothetical protein [Pseudomonas parafulva]AIZ32941.1 hypothetical protein NJ69_07985 [Pseudomonas parafulva]AXO88535.1 hypothetical protein DZC75_11200 [Pseudomonas parafulva]